MAVALPDFDAALAVAATLDEEALGRPWSFRGRAMDVRYALYRTLEDAQEAYVGVAVGPHPESRRILALADRALGDLRGLVIGLPDDLLDRAPRDGEWPVREVLRHMLWIERRYALQTLYAVERADSDPMRMADDRLPPLARIDGSGGSAEVLGRMAAARAETNRGLGDLPPAAMTRPTGWVSYEVDVRFRLHRFAAHLVEHTVQCDKTLAALGWRPTEGRRLARRLAGLIGEIDGLGAAGEARRLEAILAERLATAPAPANG
jgi:hypothetical protein